MNDVRAMVSRYVSSVGYGGKKVYRGPYAKCLQVIEKGLFVFVAEGVSPASSFAIRLYLFPKFLDVLWCMSDPIYGLRNIMIEPQYHHLVPVATHSERSLKNYEIYCRSAMPPPVKKYFRPLNSAFRRRYEGAEHSTKFKTGPTMSVIQQELLPLKKYNCMCNFSCKTMERMERHRLRCRKEAL